MEKDAAYLKQSIATYFERLNEVYNDNFTDADELTAVHASVVADRTLLAMIETKMLEHINYLRAINTRKTDIIDGLTKAVRERKGEV